MAQLFWKYRKFFGKFFPWFFFLFTCLNFPWRNLWIRKIDKDDAEMLRSVSFLLTSDRPLYWSKLTFYNCFQAIWSQMPRQSSKNSAFKSVNERQTVEVSTYLQKNSERYDPNCFCTFKYIEPVTPKVQSIWSYDVYWQMFSLNPFEFGLSPIFTSLPNEAFFGYQEYQNHFFVISLVCEHEMNLKGALGHSEAESLS